LRRRQIREPFEGETFAVRVERSGDASFTARGGELQTILAEPGPVDFQQFDVDDDLRACLVDSRNQTARGGDALRRVLQRDRVDRRGLRDLPDVDDDAQEVDDFLDLGVAQIERLDDLLFVLPAFGGRVGNDRDRARGGDALERMSRRRE